MDALQQDLDAASGGITGPIQSPNDDHTHEKSRMTTSEGPSVAGGEGIHHAGTDASSTESANSTGSATVTNVQTSAPRPEIPASGHNQLTGNQITHGLSRDDNGGSIISPESRRNRSDQLRRSSLLEHLHIPTSPLDPLPLRTSATWPALDSDANNLFERATTLDPHLHPLPPTVLARIRVFGNTPYQSIHQGPWVPSEVRHFPQSYQHSAGPSTEVPRKKAKHSATPRSLSFDDAHPQFSDPTSADTQQTSITSDESTAVPTTYEPTLDKQTRAEAAIDEQQLSNEASAGSNLPFGTSTNDAFQFTFANLPSVDTVTVRDLPDGICYSPLTEPTSSVTYTTRSGTTRDAGTDFTPATTFDIDAISNNGQGKDDLDNSELEQKDGGNLQGTKGLFEFVSANLGYHDSDFAIATNELEITEGLHALNLHDPSRPASSPKPSADPFYIDSTVAVNDNTQQRSWQTVRISNDLVLTEVDVPSHDHLSTSRDIDVTETKELLLNGQINGHRVLAVPDTGSTINLMKLTEAARLGLTIGHYRKDVHGIIMTIDRATIECVGVADAFWSFPSEPKAWRIGFYIVENPPRDVVVGNPFLSTTDTLSFKLDRFCEKLVGTHTVQSVGAFYSAQQFHSLPSINVHLLGSTEPALVDSGSETNIIALDFALQKGLTIDECPRALVMADGREIQTAGFVWAEWDAVFPNTPDRQPPSYSCPMLREIYEASCKRNGLVIFDVLKHSMCNVVLGQQTIWRLGLHESGFPTADSTARIVGNNTDVLVPVVSRPLSIQLSYGIAIPFLKRMHAMFSKKEPGGFGPGAGLVGKIHPPKGAAAELERIKKIEDKRQDDHALAISIADPAEQQKLQAEDRIARQRYTDAVNSFTGNHAGPATPGPSTSAASPGAAHTTSPVVPGPSNNPHTP